MIRKLAYKMLTAQILSALTVTICLLVDEIMIGRFLGEQALAAYGLANPVILAIGAVGSMLCAGAQVACGKSLGKGDIEETNAGYSSAAAAAALCSLVFLIIVLPLGTPFARILGAKEGKLLTDTSRYMAGFGIGAPASMFSLILVPFLQMAGQSTLLIVAVLGMTVADIVFDLISVFVFRAELFGMGLASALSYYVAILIGGSYFLSKKCIYTFSFKKISLKKIMELIEGGTPNIVGLAAGVALVFEVNHILLKTFGPVAVAAYAVVNTIINASNCISTGSGGVALTLSGVLYNEEDRKGLSQLLVTLIKSSVILGIAVMALLMIFSKQFVTFFIPHATQSQDIAVHGLRIFALGVMFCCLTNTLRSSYQGIGRVLTMEVISVTDNFLIPAVAAFYLSWTAGIDRTWYFFLISEILTLIGIFVHVWIVKGRITFSPQDILLLPDDFGTKPEYTLEADTNNVDDLKTFSEKAKGFSISHGADEKLAGELAACIIDTGGRIISHAFGKKGKNDLSICLQRLEGKWKLRFRDNGKQFDPIDRSAGKKPEDLCTVPGINVEKNYTYTMNLNKLTLVFKEPA